MDQALYTIILDFRGGTYVAQVEAIDETDALRRWAMQFSEQKVVGRSSATLAKALIKALDVGSGPVALEGMRGVWCATALTGRSLIVANIVRAS